MDFDIYLHLIACNNIGKEIQKIHNLLPPENSMSMFDEYEKKKRQQVSLMRSLMDYGIGVIIVVMGLFLFFRNQLDIDFNDLYPPNKGDKFLGVLFVAYGIWRIYRGYKKNYFR